MEDSEHSVAETGLDRRTDSAADSAGHTAKWSAYSFDTLEYDPDSGVYHGRFSRDCVRPSIAAVEAVSAVTDTDPGEITPLYSTIDPDALDTLCRSERQSGEARVTFTLSDYDVTLSTDGDIEIAPRSHDDTH